MLAYSCSECGREYIQPLEGLVERLRSGRTRCQLCGGDLTFPEEVSAALAGGGDGVDLEALAEYACDACGKTWKTSATGLQRRRRTGCRFCGAPLRAEVLAILDSLAEERTGPVAHARLECLICLRPTLVDSPAAEEQYACQFCGVRLRLPMEDGEPARPPPPTEPAASRDEVAAILDEAGGLGDLAIMVGEFLVARAERGDVGAGEARFLASQLAVLSRWSPEPGRAFLPIHIDEAVRTVPALLYPGQHCRVERRPEGTDLVFTIKSRRRMSGATVTNMIGFATLAFAGMGVFVTGEEEAMPDQRQIRIAVRSVAGGVELVPFAEIHNERPKLVGGKAARAFAGGVADRANALTAYYGALTLFGTWAGGLPAVSVTVPAIAHRLTALGLGGQTGRWATHLLAK